jgi:GNAT superfamily N-acetyltransferase
VNRTQVTPARRPEIRPARHEDREPLRQFLSGLSLQTRYLRFFSGIVPTTPGMLRILLGERGDVMVATDDGNMIGHAMAGYVPDPGGTCAAHIGVVVADGRRGQGVGSALLRALDTAIQARGATTLIMDVLPENTLVLNMIATRWPAAHYAPSPEYLTITAPAAPPPPTSPAMTASPATPAVAAPASPPPPVTQSGPPSAPQASPPSGPAHPHPHPSGHQSPRRSGRRRPGRHSQPEPAGIGGRS